MRWSALVLSIHFSALTQSGNRNVDFKTAAPVIMEGSFCGLQMGVSLRGKRGCLNKNSNVYVLQAT